MHRLAAVADEVAPIAEIADRQQLAQLPVAGKPEAVTAPRRPFFARRVDAPMGEILDQLLPAVDDRVIEIAGLVLVAAGLAQQRVVFLARRRQRVERELPRHLGVVIEVHVVAGVALGVMRPAGALGAVRLAAELGDHRRRLAAAQEARNLRREAFDREQADQPVPARAPGPGPAGQDGEQRGEEKWGQAAGAVAHRRPCRKVEAGMV
ncbi:MAG TPA: hypothetical protein VE397_01235 [Stellaceae bacterium]|nr:hypothetical protein [Stellaceae bacterium]